MVRATHTGRSDWEGALRRGFFPDGAATETVPRALDAPAIHTALRAIPPAEAGLELCYYPSPTVHDGREGTGGRRRVEAVELEPVHQEESAVAAAPVALRADLGTQDVERQLRGAVPSPEHEAPYRARTVWCRQEELSTAAGAMPSAERVDPRAQ